ncbi:protein indeterminate-domain 2-like [Olea europaea var. sylvestris]|uniref:Indeterminate-domain 2-like n=1 Tax=Olea europaea subsp. europaea TaxID=158383 RepID=A0A8S0SM26_OLEEU|nr:protein indeterminate-domain 2-like [Olea europaea var. sylvestris]CAA2993669.1 indeterminate-domain 2-like [Olea europaea subsp. europaea]
MPADLDNCSTVNDYTASGDSSSGNQIAPPKPNVKKKRNLPGMPDPDAEVIALSPKALLATNRFVCEICNKGFQRDQNLQLHRRGHNLPWKLKQRSNKEPKKRVYVCPEPSCVHHDPLRALGDLTGIKKHFCRKHGEKKWKCDKCSKKYAVQSDWKAHSKICGTKEYKCDCGTLFSRRDSFITHRAFCDALAEESAKTHTAMAPPSADEEPQIQAVESSPSLPPSTVAPPPPQPPQAPALAISSSSGVVSSVLPVQNPELVESSNPSPSTAQILETSTPTPPVTSLTTSFSSVSSSSSSGSTSSNVFASLFASSTASGSLQSQTTNLFEALARPEQIVDVAPSSSSEPVSLCLATNQGSSIFGTAGQERRQYAPALQPAPMSATALLQKAAQMGAAASNASLLRGVGIVSSSSPSSGLQEWSGQQIKPEGAPLAAGLGLGLTCDGGSSLKELMLGTPSVFCPKHTTLDLLGLGMAASGSPSGGLSALMTSINNGLDVAAAAAAFGGGEFGGKDME